MCARRTGAAHPTAVETPQFSSIFSSICVPEEADGGEWVEWVSAYQAARRAQARSLPSRTSMRGPRTKARLAGEGADHAGDAGAHRRDAGVAGVEARGPGEVDKVALLRLVEPEDGANSGQNLLRGGDVPTLLQTDVSVGVFPCSLAACAARASGRSPGRSHSPIAASVTRWRRRHCSAGTASWRPVPDPKSALQQNATPPEQTAWAAILFATSQQFRTARIDQEKRRLSY